MTSRSKVILDYMISEEEQQDSKTKTSNLVVEITDRYIFTELPSLPKAPKKESDTRKTSNQDAIRKSEKGQGSMISETRGQMEKVSHQDYAYEVQFRANILQAGCEFTKLKFPIWENEKLHLTTKVNYYRSIILPLLIEDMEQHNPKDDDFNHLEVFHVKCMKIILNLVDQKDIPHAEVRKQFLNQSTLKTLITERKVRRYGKQP